MRGWLMAAWERQRRVNTRTGPARRAWAGRGTAARRDRIRSTGIGPDRNGDRHDRIALDRGARVHPRHGGGLRPGPRQPLQEGRRLPPHIRAERHAGGGLPGARPLGFDEGVLQGRQRPGAREPGAGAGRPPRRRRPCARRPLLHRHRRRHRHRARRPPRARRRDRGGPRPHGQDQLPPGDGRRHRPLPRQRLHRPGPRRLPDRRRADQQARGRALHLQGLPTPAVLAVRRFRQHPQHPVRLPAQARRTPRPRQARGRQRRPTSTPDPTRAPSPTMCSTTGWSRSSRSGSRRPGRAASWCEVARGTTGPRARRTRYRSRLHGAPPRTHCGEPHGNPDRRCRDRTVRWEA